MLNWLTRTPRPHSPRCTTRARSSTSAAALHGFACIVPDVPLVDVGVAPDVPGTDVVRYLEAAGAAAPAELPA